MKKKRFAPYFLIVFSLTTTIITLTAGVIIIREYLEKKSQSKIIISNPQAIIAKVEQIKKTLSEVDALSKEVETLGNSAIEASKKAEEAMTLVNLSESEIKALENRLNPYGSLWLNIGIGVIMLFTGYFLEKILDKIFKKHKESI